MRHRFGKIVDWWYDGITIAGGLAVIGGVVLAIVGISGLNGASQTACLVLGFVLAGFGAWLMWANWRDS